MIAAAGAAGLGAAWGWLLAVGRGTIRRPLRTIPRIAVATAIFGTEVALLLNPAELGPFLGATAGALWVHLAWRDQLMKRFGPIDETKEVA